MNNVIDFEYGKYEIFLNIIKKLLMNGETFIEPYTLTFCGDDYIIYKILSIQGEQLNITRV